MTDQHLAVVETSAVQVSAPAGLSIERAFRAVVEGELDAPKLAVMRELLKMDAEQKFNAAFVVLQSELPVIVASTAIPNRGKYQRYEDIMDKDGVSAVLARNGFTVSFTQDFKDNRILETCTLSHSGGHSRSNTFAVRVGRADSDTQADCKAATTAKRNALMNALNLVIRQDCLNEENDAAIEGDPNAKLSAEQAFEIERRVNETNSNVAAMLKFCGARSFAEIPASKYSELDNILRRKENVGK